MADQVVRETGEGFGRAHRDQALPRLPDGSRQQHYDFARTGQADIVWFLHGATPGRFPLTELIQLPYTVGSAEIGTKVLNDADLRGKYLDAEHKGVKVLLLFTHQPDHWRLRA